MGWIIRILLVAAGSITSWFVARDALNFNIIQMVVAVVLITFLVIIIAFWRDLSNLFKQFITKYKKS
ncbi:hypothetical protein CAB17_13860 [Legionella sainthelensi]|uniref:Uncharacterized protein n=1 Tax=Legionella sainthelensi TaxID=28087 RepID=A0A2H5FND6_9GAMM|nr:hypothetical protein CAB17_13860 [Legionella sainthelensi]